MSNLLQQLNAESAALVERVRGSLVRVSNGPGGAGAGTIWNSEGLIITNAHVVHQDSPEVTLPDGRRLRSRVVGYDQAHDLALLAITARRLPTLPLGDSHALRPGDLVFAVGHPFGLNGVVTAGVVIGMGADLGEGGRAGRANAPAEREWLMASLVLRPGNSGGPLVDTAGRLVGVNTIMTGPEVGGAVPVHLVKRFLEACLSA